MDSINRTANVLISEFINPAVYLLSAFALVWFLYGVFMFVLARYQSNEDGIKRGKRHMIWGLVGLVIIYSASAIYNFITSFFN